MTSSKDAGQGPGRMIPVKQGDLIDLSTKYWFEDLAMEDNRLTIAQIVQSLALSLISSGGDVVDNIESLTNAYTNSQSMEYLALSNLVAEMFEDVDLSKPQAFMIYLSLNEKFVASKSPYSGFIQVTEANQLGVLVRDQLKMPLNGYFHVFLVNASSKPVNFDNMTVNVIKANVLQQMDYYPFGLMYQKQDVNATNNLLWHHGKELQENEFAQQGKSLDLEDFGARMYDPVVARWWSVDPKASKAPGWSPYRAFFDNPLRFMDPDGQLEGEFRDRQGNYLGNDGIEDGNIYLLNEGETVNLEDKSVNWGGTLSEEDSKELKEKSSQVGGLIIQNRIEEGDDYTISEFTTVGGETNVNGYILEPGGPSTTDSGKDKRIPEGVYSIDKYSSKKHPNSFILFNNLVSKARAILYHSGNNASHTEGCNLPGSTKDSKTGTVGGSRAKMQEITTFINSIGASNVKTIINNKIPKK